MNNAIDSYFKRLRKEEPLLEAEPFLTRLHTRIHTSEVAAPELESVAIPWIPTFILILSAIIGLVCCFATTPLLQWIIQLVILISSVWGLMMISLLFLIFCMVAAWWVANESV